MRHRLTNAGGPHCCSRSSSASLPPGSRVRAAGDDRVDIASIDIESLLDLRVQAVTAKARAGLGGPGHRLRGDRRRHPPPGLSHPRRGPELGPRASSPTPATSCRSACAAWASWATSPHASSCSSTGTPSPTRCGSDVEPGPAPAARRRGARGGHQGPGGERLRALRLLRGGEPRHHRRRPGRLRGHGRRRGRPGRDPRGRGGRRGLGAEAAGGSRASPPPTSTRAAASTTPSPRWPGPPRLPSRGRVRGSDFGDAATAT